MVGNTGAKHLVWLEEVGKDNISEVGGKNANLGEMIRELTNRGIPVPEGFATTADAYFAFLEANDMVDTMQALLEDLRTGIKSLHEVGSTIRHLFAEAEFPSDIADSIRAAYRELGKRYDTDNISVAVRSKPASPDSRKASSI